MPVVHFRCSLYLNTHLWYAYNPTVPVSMPGQGTLLFFIGDSYHTGLFAFKKVQSIADIKRSANLSTTNRRPIVEILSLISVYMLFDRLSNMRIQSIDTRPRVIASLWLYR